ncbi:MAG: hypothetical protein KF764_28635 [Labilithrix sp.]|nr:hypothetical protein [Labilithrix sp.]
MVKTCAKTMCESINESRRAKCNSCTSECAVLDGCNSATICSVICTPEACGDSGGECAEYGFEAVGLVSDPVVYAACMASQERFAECVERAAAPNPEACSFAALSYRREVYGDDIESIRTRACDSYESVGGPRERPSTFGRDLCDAFDAKCGAGACKEVFQRYSDPREYLDFGGNSLREDVTAAGLRCTEEASAKDSRSCLDAWRSAIGL